MGTKIELLLRENVKGLGKCGDVVRVARGYARNYLVPRRIAIDANEANKALMNRRRTVLDKEEALREAEINALVALISGTVVTTTMKADEHGHLFGSVNAGAISALLLAAGKPVEEKAVRLDAPIKLVGTHPVKVHVHGDRTVEVSVVVVAEAALAAPAS